MADASNDASPTALPILRAIHQAQQQHGIPIQDYGQYSHYLTNKLRRLRHHKESNMIRSAKFVSGAPRRKKHAYTAREVVPADDFHPNHLWHVLFEAERCWAHAAEQQKEGKPHAQVQRKLLKAHKFATKAHDLAKFYANDDTQVQMDAYVSWIHGQLLLEKKRFLPAYEAFHACQEQLQALRTSIQDSSTSQLLLSDVYAHFAERMVQPLLRFCQYEAKVTASHAIETKTVTQENQILLHYAGRDIALDPFPPLAVLYLRVQPLLEASTLHDEEAKYLHLSNDLDDALTYTVDEGRRFAALPDGPAIQAKRDELALLRSYFEYQKLATQLRQQQARMDEHWKHDRLVHAYDGLQQTAQAMVDALPSDLEHPQDDEFWLEAQAHVLRFRTIRCFHLACVYEGSLPNSQVLALLAQATKLQNRAVEEVAACELGVAYEQELEQLLGKIEAAKCRVEATEFLAQQGEATVSCASTDKPLLFRLHEMSASTVLADDLNVIPMPPKPVFYDVAYHRYTGDFPLSELDAYLAEHAPKPEAKKGLFGF